jgi:hypothetical protein
VDYAGCKVDRKSTSGTCQFFGRSLVCWSSKKQNFVALSTVKVEYVAAGSCCVQLLWMWQTLKDYGCTLNHVPLLCDNESAIKIAYNPCEHSRTKHIDIWHHFLRDRAIKGDIVISYVRTNEQLTDIFTKLLDERRFWELRSELSIIDSHNLVWLIAHKFVYWKWFETNILMLLLQIFRSSWSMDQVALNMVVFM